jgi:trimeric autotransporter adhesin
MSVFNPNIVPVNGLTTIVVNAEGVNLTNSFVNQSGDQMTGELTLMGDAKIIYPDGTSQTTAFNNERAQQLDSLINLVNNMSNTQNELTINSNMRVSGELIIPNNSLNFSNVSNLGSSFSQVNTSINNINNNITALQSSVGVLNNLNIGTTLNNHDDSISSLQTTITNLVNELDEAIIIINSNNQEITNNINDINTINTTIGNIQSDLDIKNTAINLNLNNIQSLITNINTQNDTIDNLNNQIVGLGNEINKIGTVSNIEDLNNSINTIQTTLSNLTNLQDIDITNFVDINNTLNQLQEYNTTNDTWKEDAGNNIDNLVIFKDETMSNLSDLNAFKLSATDDITNLQLFETNTNTELGNLGTTQNNLTTVVNDLSSFQILQESYNLTNDTNINTINDFKASQESYNLTNDGNISTINSTLLTKQNIINGSNKINIENVDLGVSSLSFVDITSSLAEKLNNLNNKDVSHDSSISTINSSISTLQAADVIHDGLISNINSSITTINNNINTKMDIIDVNNLLSSELIETTLNTTLDEALVNIENAINTKQNIIDVDNKLLIDNIDLTGSSLSYIDISSNLQQQLTNINNSISTLQTLQNGDITSFQTIQDNFDTLETLVNTKQDIINDTTNLLPSSNIDYSTSALRFVNINSNLQEQLNSISSQVGGAVIPSISYDSNNTTTTISDITIIDTLEFLDNTQQTTAFTDIKDSKITTNEANIGLLDTRLTTAENTIITNTSDILLKNDIIDINNKLSIGLIDLETSALNYVDNGLTQNISTSIGELNTSMAALQTSDESQTTSINNLTTTVNNLQNNKQDIISGSNLVSSDYTSYNATTVKLELDSINTSLSNKVNTSTLTSYAPLNNPTFTGTVGGLTKSMVGLSNVDNTSDTNKPLSTATTNALNLKANINNQEFTGYIQTPRIFENIMSSYTSFTSNVLTYDYANGSILYFGGLTTATNFRLDLLNVNPNNETNRSFTFSLIINTVSYKAYVNDFRLGATSYTLRAIGGASNLSVDSSAVTAIQTFTIVYTSSTTPHRILTNLSSYF